MPPKKIKKVCLRKMTSLGYSVENSDYLSTEHWPDKEGVRNSEWKAVQKHRLALRTPYKRKALQTTMA